MNRAYRRPVEKAEVSLYLDLFKDQYAKGFGFAKSMISTYTAVLTSPGFLFVEETPGKLDHYALATRLALFLWNSAPDDAARGFGQTWRDKQPCRTAIRDGSACSTTRNRGDSSRRLPTIGSICARSMTIRPPRRSTTTMSSTTRSSWRAVAETRLFVAELLKEDLPARNIVDSDFTFLNERLAKHYGIDGVEGTRMRKVSLDDKQRPRRPDDAGQRAEGHGKRHDDVARPPRRLDYGANTRLRDAASAAGAGR